MNDVNEVIKAVMKHNHVSQADVARFFNVSPQSVNNKFRRGTWDLSEVIQLLEYMHCSLVVKSGEIVEFKF